MVSMRFSIAAIFAAGLSALSPSAAVSQDFAEFPSLQASPESGAASRGADKQAEPKPDSAARRDRMNVSVVMDQALLVRSPESVKTIIVGNPGIADVSSEGKGMLVITGKAYGSTNLILVSGEGNVVGESLISVVPARAGIVTVQSGPTSKEAYSCNPRCMPTPYLGTSQAFFNDINAQSQAKSAGSPR